MRGVGSYVAKNAILKYTANMDAAEYIKILERHFRMFAFFCLHLTSSRTWKHNKKMRHELYSAQRLHNILRQFEVLSLISSWRVHLIIGRRVLASLFYKIHMKIQNAFGHDSWYEKVRVCLFFSFCCVKANRWLRVLSFPSNIAIAWRI